MRYDLERAEESDSPLRFHSRNQIKMKAGLNGEKRVANRTVPPKVSRAQRRQERQLQQNQELLYGLTASDNSTIPITEEERLIALGAGYNPVLIYSNPRKDSAA